MEQIVKEVLGGRQGAATRFYRQLAPRVRAYLRNKLPRETDVEDVLQETFVSVFDSLPLYRGDAKIETWVMAIARHEAADFYRKRYVRSIVQQTSPLFEDMVEEARTPEFEWKKKKLEERFEKAYKSLSKPYQEILSLRFELGMSVKEVAAKMEMSFKATESLLYRARTAFAVAYEQIDGE